MAAPVQTGWWFPPCPWRGGDATRGGPSNRHEENIGHPKGPEASRETATAQKKTPGRRLPHSLVDAFHSTLEEATDADILLFVVDASDPEAELQLQTARDVTRELGAESKPGVVILNKIDRLEDLRHLHFIMSREVPHGMEMIPVSARTGNGIPELRRTLASQACEKNESDATISR